ncbi:MAG: type II toxin-antitoxin system VapC family toxin [Candidatus Eremiobacterota bacterium]
MNYVIDSSALIAVLWNEQGGIFVSDIIDKRDNSCFIHVVNLCEVYYDLIRRTGKKEADETIEGLSSILSVRDDIDKDFWKQVGEYKGELKRISLADCFCIVLAKRLNSVIVTADHHEFDTIYDRGMVSVKFIR